MHAALPQRMYDLDAINADQLVTRTDLVLRGNLVTYRKAAFARGSKNYSVAARYALARSAVATAGESEERTVFVRMSDARPFYMLCAVAAIAWLCVAAVCLLT
jgi:hypothetical protein